MNENEKINEVIRRLINFYNSENKRIHEKDYENIVSFMQGELNGYLIALNVIAEEFEIEAKEISKKIEIYEKEE